MLSVGAITAQTEDVGDPRAARIAIVRENPTGEPEGDSLLEAAAAVVVSEIDVLWFDLEAFDFDSAREVQAEVLARLSVERSGEEPNAQAVSASSSVPARPDRYTLCLQFFQVPHRRSDGATMIPLSEREITVGLDRGGRYQRIETWQPFIEIASDAAATARPVATVTIRSSVPVTLIGLPPWLEGEVPANPQTRHDLELRTLRQYEIIAEAPGYRPVPRSFYLEYDSFTIDIEPRKYPRHSVGFIPRGLSWPAVEYMWYDNQTRWTVFGGVTTFAWGLTPLQQMGTAPKGDERPPRDAKIISSIPLHEIEIGGGRFLLDRDRSGRALVSASAVLRITNLDDEWSVEPVAPTALRLGIGWEQELPWRLILTQRVATDLFWPIRPEFLGNPPWAYRLGPILWHLPVYRLGVRVVL
jgi:hypothetical protein